MLHILWQRWACLTGRHRGNNFCAYCGKQIRSYPVYPFRVYSLDGKVDVRVYALNAHQAKRRFLQSGRTISLIVERLPTVD